MADDLASTPTPLAPPKTQGDKVSWLRLIRSRRVGVATFFRLMNEYGSAETALSALPEVARQAGVKYYTPFWESAAKDEIARGKKLGAKLLFFGEPEYPGALAEIPDPPPVLWSMGQPSVLQRKCIGIIGARNASSLGTRMAQKLALGLGEAGFTIISGLARGIDAAAHSASIQSGTVGVQAGGIDVVYPRENTSLFEQMVASGLRLSEQPIGLQPQARHFPPRNRIISGLSEAIIVVEAAAKSGSLITARNALDQGRDVLVVPGHPMDGRASGCNMLIRDGATLVRSVEDVIDALPKKKVAAAVTKVQPSVHSKLNLHDAHQKILGKLGPSPLGEDQLIRDLALPARLVMAELTALELDKKIERMPGGKIVKVA